MSFIILLAAHINKKDQVGQLIKTLQSINDQVECAKFLVRISVSVDLTEFESKEEKEEKGEIKISPLVRIQTLINLMNTKKYPIQFHDSNLSYFEHYKFLVNSIDSPKGYILLTKDGDIWQQIRLGVYEGINPEEGIKFFSYVPASKKFDSYSEDYQDFACEINHCKRFFTLDLQLKSSFCDYFYMKYLWLSNHNTIVSKRATSDKELITIPKRDDLEFDLKNIDKSIEKGFEIFMARSFNQIASDWVTFCKGTVPISLEFGRRILEFFFKEKDLHMFSNKNLKF